MQQITIFGNIEDIKKEKKVKATFRGNRIYLNVEGFGSVELAIKGGNSFDFEVPTELIDFEYQKEEERKEIIFIKKDEVLTFKIDKYTFYVKLKQDLKLVKDKTRYSRLQNVNCIVSNCSPKYNYLENMEFKPESCSSINQAYSFISSKYFTDRGTHTRKVWDTFKWKDELLKEYRTF